jgi:diguanylate cyclase (GGDEF)-like protein/PAS domain S-box-containing protein
MQFAIICVDDDPLVLSSLTEQLGRSLGYEHIESAASASEALKLCADLHQEGIAIPVVISDQRMPGISGDQLLAQLHRQYPKTLKILLTGQSSLEDVVRTVNFANLYRYIAKPWDEADLLLTVKEALRSYFQSKKITAQREALSQANQQLEKSLALLQATLESTADGILVVDNEGKITHYNQKMIEFWGLENASGWLNDSQEKSTPNDRQMLASMANQIENPSIFARQIGHWHQPFTTDNRVVLKLKNGKTIECYSHVQSLDGKNVGRVWSFHDITEKLVKEEVIHYQAHYDSLTGLSNRKQLSQQLTQLLAKTATDREHLAVLFIDLDHFQEINEQIGHLLGDRLLQQIAQRLKQCCRTMDLLARWGGDEFAIVLPQMVEGEDISAIAQGILKSLYAPFELENNCVRVTCSIGIAIYPTDGQDPIALLKNADTALSQAKNQGRNDYQFYTPETHDRSQTDLALENSFFQALEREEFSLYYQPQVDTATGEITHVESMLFWHHPDLGFISPDVFLPIAERKGAIVRLGNWFLQRACAQAMTWRAMGFKPIKMTVDLFPRQFWHRELLPTISQTLSQTGLPPQYLELEIPETTIMEDIDLAQKILLNIQQLGISIAIDDFGTGYSSLRYLQQFPLDTLKIDRAFVRDLRRDAYYNAIVDALLTLGRGLKIRVVAQGVSTIEVKNLLHAMQCHYMQGTWFHRPLPAQEITQVLKQDSQRFHNSLLNS